MDAAEKRKQLAEALKRGSVVTVSPSGEVMTSEETGGNSSSGNIVVPEGKLA